MADKFTPGKWWTTESGVRDKGGYICFTPQAQRYPDQDERFVQEKAERAANKLLLAAAPELLATARAVMEWWETAQYLTAGEFGDYNLFDSDPEFVTAARTAIRKSTGEPS